MSMNIHIYAKAPAKLYLENGKEDHREVVEEFPCIQTPTNITDKIIESDSPIETYKEYVRSLDNHKTVQMVPYWWIQWGDETEKDYGFLQVEEENPTMEGKQPDGYEMFPTQSMYHIDKLDYWIGEHDGWEIVVSWN